MREQEEGDPLCAGGPPRSTAVLVRNQGEQRSENDIPKKVDIIVKFPYQSKRIYLVKELIRINGGIKIFHNEQIFSIFIDN